MKLNGKLSGVNKHEYLITKKFGHEAYLALTVIANYFPNGEYFMWDYDQSMWIDVFETDGLAVLLAAVSFHQMEIDNRITPLVISNLENYIQQYKLVSIIEK